MFRWLAYQLIVLAIAFLMMLLSWIFLSPVVEPDPDGTIVWVDDTSYLTATTRQLSHGVSLDVRPKTFDGEFQVASEFTLQESVEAQSTHRLSVSDAENLEPGSYRAMRFLESGTAGQEQVTGRMSVNVSDAPFWAGTLVLIGVAVGLLTAFYVTVNRNTLGKVSQIRARCEKLTTDAENLGDVNCDGIEEFSVSNHVRVECERIVNSYVKSITPSLLPSKPDSDSAESDVKALESFANVTFTALMKSVKRTVSRIDKLQEDPSGLPPLIEGLKTRSIPGDLPLELTPEVALNLNQRMCDANTMLDAFCSANRSIRAAIDSIDWSIEHPISSPPGRGSNSAQSLEDDRQLLDYLHRKLLCATSLDELVGIRNRASILEEKYAIHAYAGDLPGGYAEYSPTSPFGNCLLAFVGVCLLVVTYFLIAAFWSQAKFYVMWGLGALVAIGSVAAVFWLAKRLWPTIRTSLSPRFAALRTDLQYFSIGALVGDWIVIVFFSCLSLVAITIFFYVDSPFGTLGDYLKVFTLGLFAGGVIGAGRLFVGKILPFY